METSASLLDRLAGKPTDDDWRRLLELYQPLLLTLDGPSRWSALPVRRLAQQRWTAAFRRMPAVCAAFCKSSR